MMTTFDFMMASMIVGSGGSAESVARVQRIRATVTWVRAACERDGHPAWLVELVVANVERAFIRGDFPLVEGNEQ